MRMETNQRNRIPLRPTMDHKRTGYLIELHESSREVYGDNGVMLHTCIRLSGLPAPTSMIVTTFAMLFCFRLFSI